MADDMISDDELEGLLKEVSGEDKPNFRSQDTVICDRDSGKGNMSPTTDQEVMRSGELLQARIEEGTELYENKDIDLSEGLDPAQDVHIPVRGDYPKPEYRRFKGSLYGEEITSRGHSNVLVKLEGHHNVVGEIVLGEAGEVHQLRPSRPELAKGDLETLRFLRWVCNDNDDELEVIKSVYF